MNFFIQARPPFWDHAGHKLQDYSLYNAFHPLRNELQFVDLAQNQSYLHLTSELCPPDSDGLYDCFGSCNSTTIFSSLPRLHNCVVGMLLPNVTSMHSDIKVTTGFDSGHFPPAFANVTGKVHLTGKVPVKLVTPEAARHTGEIIVQCIQSGFHTFDESHSPLFNDPNAIDLDPIQQLTSWNSTIAEDDLCRLVPGRINPDLGGIGVRFPHMYCLPS